ncbi:SDR family oxidoreductase [Paracidovorax citrulli]|uniref:SDR family oxidoreductase n=1 Tax=Paracidovorax citrulli TaxID=80869 RepID=UPI0009446BB4|nr:SDR family oxidoreductase [Paracidovorax citrulli]UMT89868.1 SDR family oxidoreductase [Paracidovorax citrulli]WIY35347.1 SDR family oxidoreductase [Paracidovorax citrulli]
MPSSASPRTVLVTGAARRLGREIALALAAAGWRVAVHYRGSREEALRTAADCAARTPGSAVFDADFHDEAAVRALLPRVAAELGTVDAVVNSASLFEHDDAASFGFAALEKHLRSNTAAPILLAQALHAHLAARSGAGADTEAAAGAEAGARPLQGVVVNLLDQKLWNPNPDFLSYTLSKAALESANTLLAQALAPRVRVVGVAPGLTLTSHMLSDEKFRELHRQSPLGRSSTPEDVAAAVRFALENRSITGTTLLVDGGQHLMRFERDFSLM